MRGSPLTSNECVQTMLAYFDRLERDGATRASALNLTAAHFGIDAQKVSHFVDERRIIPFRSAA